MGMRSRSAVWIVVASVLGLVAAGWAAPSTSDSAAPVVAVENAAGEEGAALVPVVSSALAERVEAMRELRTQADGPWELYAKVASLDMGDGSARVVVLAKLNGPSGEVSYSAEGVGEAATASEAAGAAAGTAMERLGVVVNARGNVYFIDDRLREVRTTLTMRHGIRPGARVAFLRKGRMVAEGTVIIVRNGYSIARPAEDTPGGAIVGGDDVRVMVNGPRSAVDRQVAGEKRERDVLSVLVLGLFGWLIGSAR